MQVYDPANNRGLNVKRNDRLTVVDVLNNFTISKSQNRPAALFEILSLSKVFCFYGRSFVPIESVAKNDYLFIPDDKVSYPTVVHRALFYVVDSHIVKQFCHRDFNIRPTLICHEHKNPARVRAHIIFSNPTGVALNCLLARITVQLNKIGFSQSAFSPITTWYRAILPVAHSLYSVEGCELTSTLKTVTDSVLHNATRKLTKPSILTDPTAIFRVSIHMAFRNVFRFAANNARYCFSTSVFCSHKPIVTRGVC